MNNRSMPLATVIPELAYDDVSEAVTWLCEAFGFTPRLLIASHRAQLNVGDGAIVVTGRGHRSQPSSHIEAGHAVMVRVPGVDEHCARARAYGARVLSEPTSFPYGERQYSVVDLGGHAWTFSQSVSDVDPTDWGGTLL